MEINDPLPAASMGLAEVSAFKEEGEKNQMPDVFVLM
jgi:hypothetical protein